MNLPLPAPTRTAAFVIAALLAALPVSDAASDLGPLRGAVVVLAPALVALLFVLRHPTLPEFLGHAIMGAWGIALGTIVWGYAFGPSGVGEAVLLPFRGLALWVMSAALAYIGGTLGLLIAQRRQRRASRR